MGTKTSVIYDRLCKIQRTIAENIDMNKSTPLSIEDILLVQLLSSGTVRIDNRGSRSEVMLDKITRIKNEIQNTNGFVFGPIQNDSTNSCNLILGELVDVRLHIKDVTQTTTLLKNIDIVVVPDSPVYREQAEKMWKNMTTTQKILSLSPNDIINTIFKMNTFKTRLGKVIPTEINTINDLVDVTDNDDFILMLSDDLAFMSATLNNIDEEGNPILDDSGEPVQDQKFYLISNDAKSEAPIQMFDYYDILLFYINDDD